MTLFREQLIRESAPSVTKKVLPMKDYRRGRNKNKKTKKDDVDHAKTRMEH